MQLIQRNDYINWLKEYKDKKIIKVLTGLRRVGKSTIFDLYINELKNSGIKEEQILKINFEEVEYEDLLDRKALYSFIKQHMIAGKTLYVFLDEIQRVEGFETVIDSLFVKDNIDLYLTGSNAKFLSSEIATILTGRYVEINVLPLSFKEYYDAFKSDKLSRRELFMN